jgi:hypothetical protein
MWKLLSESVEGTSHRRAALPCQDRSRAEQIQLENDTVIVLACADGAGSAELSQVGAQIACDRFFEVAYEALRSGIPIAAIDRSITLGWYKDVRDCIYSEAERRGVPGRNLACTLLTAIVTESNATFAQVGDGTIVRRVDESYESVFWPQSGDYANVTNFITQDQIETTFEFLAVDAVIDEVALLTDGLQRLVLDFAKRSVHQAFFKPFFAALTTAEHADELAVPLRTFLDSPNVNERTDDDKTLILASRIRESAPRAC